MEAFTQVVVEMDRVIGTQENTPPVGVIIPPPLQQWVTLHLTIFHKAGVTQGPLRMGQIHEAWWSTNLNHPHAVTSSIIHHLHPFHFIRHLHILTQFLIPLFNIGKYGLGSREF